MKLLVIGSGMMGSAAAFADHLRVVWLTPAMDQRNSAQNTRYVAAIQQELSKRLDGLYFTKHASVIALGVLFMLNEFYLASFHRTWPILLIVIGLVKVLAGNTTGHVDVIAPAPPGAPPAPTQNPEPPQVDHV